jgi:hypothetical protein
MAFTISCSVKSVNAGITMNEPTKDFQDLLPQMDCPIGENIIFQQNQLKNNNFKKQTSASDKQHPVQTSSRLAPISSKSPISGTIPSNIQLQLNKGILRSISKRNQELQPINIKITNTKSNIIPIHFSTKTSILYHLMQAITWIIIIYTSIIIIQALTKCYASKTTSTHPNNSFTFATPPTYSANINTNASATTKLTQSLSRKKRYINNTTIYYHSSGHHRPTQRHQLRTLNRLLQYGRRCRQINPRQLYYGYIRDCRMERVTHDMERINDIKDCYHIGPLLNNFNKCNHLVSPYFLLTCNLTNLLGVVFSFYKKLFALLRYQKDTASLNPSSTTNGSDQSSNRPPIGRPSTRATQLTNPLDPNLSFALPIQDTLLTGKRASTGLLLTSRNPSSFTNNADKALPQQNLNFSYAPQ